MNPTIHIKDNPIDKVWRVTLPDGGEDIYCEIELQARIFARTYAKSRSCDVVLWRKGYIADIWYYSDKAKASKLIPKGEEDADPQGR